MFCVSEQGLVDQTNTICRISWMTEFNNLGGGFKIRLKS